MGRGVEETDLLRLQAVDGVAVHLNQYVRVGMASFYSGAGNIVCFLRQSLGDEYLFARFHYAGIVDVHVLDEKPGADAVGGERAMFFRQL